MTAPVEAWLLAEVAGSAPDHLDACVAAGMLRERPGGVEFRHELARLAIEQSVPPGRRADLHRRTLAALLARPLGNRDPARLAHHAEGAGDAAAVLTHAVPAAEWAAALGAHNTAAAQYDRVLRFAAGLTPPELAHLLDRHAYECYLTSRLEDAIASQKRALTYWAVYNNLAANLLNLREFAAAEQWITEGVEYCAERDLDPWRLSLRSLLADIRLARGDWKGAVELADELVGNARTPPFVRVSARPRAAAVSRRLRTMGARGVARGPQNATRTNPAKLTKREIEVLTLIADGLRNAEIAGRLFISVKTVDHHVSAILGKLGARSRGHAARALPGLLGTADGP